jgi:chitosanase
MTNVSVPSVAVPVFGTSFSVAAAAALHRNELAMNKTMLADAAAASSWPYRRLLAQPQKVFLPKTKAPKMLPPGVSLDQGLLGVPVALGTLSGTPLGVWTTCEWRLVAAPGGTYNVLSAHTGGFLSVAYAGHLVDIYHTDDGSGRQRFAFEQVGSGAYRLRVAGGKADGLVYLRATAGGLGVGLATANDTSRRAIWAIKRLPPRPSAPPGSIGPPGQVPPAAAERVLAVTGLSAAQVSVVLGMIGGPEQATTRWWLDASGGSVYGYAEDIGDGRGVTIGLYGATTGRGYDDANALFEAYGRPDVPRMSKTRDIVAAVRGFASDPKWREAMWAGYLDTYIEPTMKLLHAHFPRPSALTVGAVLDASMNAGLGDDSGRHWGSQHLVAAAAAAAGGEESRFLDEFLQLRRRYPTAHSGDMERRVGAWARLAADGAWDLDVDVDKYAYIP